ncbi:MAG TPA: FMN-binding protein [Streptosporangiaceae bacterium]|nr:FMN-binding protein [Streptosporangiaceae bacterium]
MRRVILAVTGTVAGLVALLSFRSHVPSVPVAASGTSGNTGASAGGAGQPAPSASLAAGQRAIDGNVANTAYGPVQVQVLVKNSKIVTVNILEQPSSTAHDLQIGQFAFPQLIHETLTAQSGRIDAVSGATYTSQGYIQSLQSALDNGA